MIKFYGIIAVIFLLYIFVSRNIQIANIQFDQSNLQKIINSFCPNIYVDKENQFSFCLPINYRQVASDKKSKFATASFSPSKDYSCNANDGSYCYVTFFNYLIGDTEVPPKRTESATISFADQTFQTENGEIMKLYNPFHPAITDNIYSFKLKSGKYVYFQFVSSHVKAETTEFDTHTKILKSVKQI